MQRSLGLAISALCLVLAGDAFGQEVEGGEDSSAGGRRERRRAEPPPFDTGVVDGTVAEPPTDAIRVEIRYDQSLGYKLDGPSSCIAFSVYATTEPPPPNDRPIAIRREDAMAEKDGAYVCEFLLLQVPRGPVTVVAEMHQDEATAAWQGGTQPAPPSGWRREIADGRRVVTISDAEPRASVSFVMAYAPVPDFVAPRRNLPIFDGR